MSAVLPRGRYAPSPTGNLHLGNLRTALVAWLVARAMGGQFILRVEDLDHPRVRAGAATRMLTDLRWLGLDWEEGPDVSGPFGPYTQSSRKAIYDGLLARLRERELVYPCYCSRAELGRLASAPHVGEDAPRYPGTCRTLTRQQRLRHEADGRRPALRFRAPTTPITFHDRLVGSVTEDVAATVGDFIVRRSDGIIAYQFAVVVDDALMAVSQVVRGADLLSSTARQLALYDALGYRRPDTFVHVPLALDASGARMSKRDAQAGITALRERGVTPARVVGALAASCGLWKHGQAAALDEVLAAFDVAALRREPTRIEL